MYSRWTTLLRLYTHLSNVPTTERVHIKVVVQVLRCAFGNFCPVFDDTVLTLVIVQQPEREFDTRTTVRVVCLFFSFLSSFFTCSAWESKVWRTAPGELWSIIFGGRSKVEETFSKLKQKKKKKRETPVSGMDCLASGDGRQACDRTVDRISDSFPFCSSRFRYRPRVPRNPWYTQYLNSFPRPRTLAFSNLIEN